MPIRFQCPCGQKLKSPDDTVRKRAKCPACGRQLRVPDSPTYDTVAEELPPKKKKKKAAGALFPAEHEEQSGGKDKARVVVADSEPQDLEKIIRILHEHGYDVLETDDGEKAIDLIRQAQPDAVVLDVSLDNLSGFRVVQQIHDPANVRNDGVWSVPVLMTASKVRGRDKQYAMSLGVRGYFSKPVAPAQLCHRLESEIAKYRAR